MPLIKKILAAFSLLVVWQGCTVIPQKSRGYLADPIMQLTDDPTESRSEGHNFPRREGSTGGSAGAGGRCGC